MTNKFAGTLLFCICSLVAPAQGWQSLYDEALKHYQKGDFKISLEQAKAALGKSEDNFHRGSSLQLITANCLALNDPDTGLKFIDEELSIFQKPEHRDSSSWAEAMKKRLLFLHQKGRDTEALAQAHTALEKLVSSYGEGSLEYQQFNITIGEIELSQGDSSAAKKTWNACLEKLANIPDSDDVREMLLFNTAALEESLDDFVSARIKYLSLVNTLESKQKNDTEIYTEAQSSLKRLDKIATVNDQEQLAAKLNDAIALQQRQRTDEALVRYKEAEAAAARINGPCKICFSVYMNHTRLLMETGNLEESARSFSLAKAAVPSQAIASFENTFVALTDADLSLLRGRREEAVKKYEGIAASRNAVGPMLEPFMVYSATLLLNLDIPTTAAILLRPLLSCDEQTKGANDQCISVGLRYADALLALHLPDSALHFLERPMFRSNIGAEFKRIEAIQFSGQWHEAFDKLKRLEQTAPSDRVKGYAAYECARIMQRLGEYPEAERYYLKASSLYGDALPEDVWQVTNSLATLYTKLGNYEKSERDLVELLQKIPPNNSLRAAVQQNLASVYIESNQMGKAIDLQTRIVAEEKKRAGEHHPDYGIALNNLGVIYQKTKQLDKAKALFETSLQVSRINSGDQSTVYASREANLGVVLKDLGEYDKASILLQQALNIFQKKLGAAHPDYIQCEYNLAITFKRMGKVDLATPLMSHLSDFYRNQVQEWFPSMNEYEQLAFYGKINKTIQDYQQFATEVGARKPELISELLDFRLSTKALLLNSSINVRRGIMSGNDPELKNQLMQWLNLKDQLGKIYSLSLLEKSAQAHNITQLEAQTNSLEKWLSSKSAAFKNDKDERQTGWKKIQASLRPGEAAVEFIRLRAIELKDSLTYVALIVTGGQQMPAMITFPDGRKMEQREFSYYRNSIQFQLPDGRSYATFWKPIEAALNNIHTIYISADGVYNKLSLPTLFDEVHQQYLNERYKMMLVPNLREIAMKPQVSSVATKATLFCPINFTQAKAAGNSLNSSTRGLPSIFSKEIPALPGTHDEIEKISKIFKAASWTTTEFTGAAASELNVKTLRDPAIVHIATHGFFISTGDEETPDAFSANGSDRNPLLRSGLVFSDISRSTTSSTEDGLLTAYEAKNLTLEATDLIVLSACETGSGSVMNGEGVYGLQRAFLVSGVKNVVMSLWKVDDNATQELMAMFYQNMLSGSGKADALQKAQADLKKKYAAPYYWGGFVLIGRQ